MNSQSATITVSPEIGVVSAAYKIPNKSKCILTLAHGAGAGMTHTFMIHLAEALANTGIATLMFNFPFIENGKKRPDLPAIAHATIKAAIDNAHKAYPSLPLFASGKSFGGRMTSQFLSLHPETMIKGIVFYGFPLHPPGKPSIDRASHLKDLKLPMLFLQGSRDELATLNLIENVCNGLSTATLRNIEGANHAFKAGKQDVISLLANYTNEWIDNILKK